MLNKFLKNFPPPQYIDVPYTGIVFSDNSVRVLVLDKKNKHPVFFSEIPLEHGIIEMGKIKNQDALSKILSEKRAELKSPFVRFSIPDETSYVFTTKVPVVAGKDAKEAVSFILEENVPLPLSDISFDFVAQEIEKSQNGYLVKVAVIAASTSLIETYVSSLRKAGLEALLCINESQATAYSVVPKGRAAVYAIIHVHKESAGIYITSGQYIEFSGVVPVPPTESLQDRLNSIKSEVLKAVAYWSERSQGTKDESSIIHCYLCGEYEILESLLREIYEIPNIRPSLANVWLNAFSIEEFLPEIPFEESLRFASAVGLFLGN